MSQHNMKRKTAFPAQPFFRMSSWDWAQQVSPPGLGAKVTSGSTSVTCPPHAGAAQLSPEAGSPLFIQPLGTLLGQAWHPACRLETPGGWQGQPWRRPHQVFVTGLHSVKFQTNHLAALYMAANGTYFGAGGKGRFETVSLCSPGWS